MGYGLPYYKTIHNDVSYCYEMAMELAAKHRFINSHSWMNGERQDIGWSGEIFIDQLFNLLNLKYTWNSLITKGAIDFTVDFSGKLITFDVKTKQRQLPPLDKFEVTVPINQINFEVDYYIFLNLQKKGEDTSKMQLIDIVSKKDFFNPNLGTTFSILKEGDVANNNMVARTSTYQRYIYDLQSLSQTKQLFPNLQTDVTSLIKFNVLTPSLQ